MRTHPYGYPSIREHLYIKTMLMIAQQANIYHSLTRNVSKKISICVPRVVGQSGNNILHPEFYMNILLYTIVFKKKLMKLPKSNVHILFLFR